MNAKNKTTTTQIPATNDRLERMKRGAKIAGAATAGVAVVGVVVGVQALMTYGLSNLGAKLWSAV